MLHAKLTCAVYLIPSSHSPCVYKDCIVIIRSVTLMHAENVFDPV